MKKISNTTKTLLIFVLLVSMFIVSCKDNPTKIVSISNLSFDNDTIFLKLNDIIMLETIIEPIHATNKDLKWSSSDINIAIVNDKGELTAISVGTVIISVSTIDARLTATCEVTISSELISVTAVTINHPTLTIEVGMSEILIATVEPDDATIKDVKWVSSNENVAIISEDGEITAISDGETIITVTTLCGAFKSTCDVNVINKAEFTELIVANFEDWIESVEYIKNNGNEKNYTITLINDISIQGTEEPTFGDVSDIIVFIQGNKSISLESNGQIIYLVSKQHLILKDISLYGGNFQWNIGWLIIVKGNDASIELQGNSMIHSNFNSLRDGISINGSRNNLIMSDNSSLVNMFGSRGGIVIVGVDNYFEMKNDSSIYKESNVLKSRSEPWWAVGIEISGDRTLFKLSDNATIRRAGNDSGIKINDGASFSMTGGLITENSGFSAGGVYVGKNSNFTMSGGTISENHLWGGFDNNPNSVYYGAGVSVVGTFIMSGGEIINNVATDPQGFDTKCIGIGGGVFVYGTFTMNGGSISGNQANSGAGVALNENSSFHFLNGIVYGNQESGAPDNLANNSKNDYSALKKDINSTAKYGDDTDILPHIEGDILGTDHTIVGKI